MLHVTPLPPIAENKYDAPAQDRTQAHYDVQIFYALPGVELGSPDPQPSILAMVYRSLILTMVWKL